jgi:1-acyl-sn-glycerol-3-phosphate acyltransferase
MSFLRSLFLSTPLIVLSTMVMGTLSMAASLFDGTGNSQHHLARLWGRSLLAFGLIRLEIEGLEKLDRGATYVFVSNHASYMDIPAILIALPFQFRFFAKSGLYRIPFLGTHLKRAGHLPVDRSNVRHSVKSMTEAARIIAGSGAGHGVSVLLFPEGGRAPKGLRDFREGAAFIAIKAGVPLAPMALVGMREKLPMGSIHIRAGRVRLRIGDPIPTAGLKVSDREELTRRLRDEVSCLLEGR